MKKNTLSYKGYEGSVEYSAEDKIFYGEILGITGLVLYEGDTVKKLTKDFKEGVEDYLAHCKEYGLVPEKQLKGSFNVRIKPQIHRLAAIRSAAMKISLNRFVEMIIEKEVLKPATESSRRRTVRAAR